MADRLDCKAVTNKFDRNVSKEHPLDRFYVPQDQ